MRPRKPIDPNGRHARVYFKVLSSNAWRCLGWPARALYCDLRASLNGFNNGNISAALSDLKHRGWSSSQTLSRALYELRALGFVAVTREGGLKQGTRVPTLYRFTDLDAYELPKVGVQPCKVANLLADEPPVTIVGNSLGGWLAWLVAQEQPAVEELILIAPAFNMMDLRAAQISNERREQWQATGSMTWDDEPMHREAPIPWHWVEDSQALWGRRFTPRRVKTTILHGLQDAVIRPDGSWTFVQHLLSQDPEFPIDVLFKTGDHRLSSPDHLETFRQLVSRSR